jgi:hypothetical protein
MNSGLKLIDTRRIAPSLTTPAATGTVRSVRRVPVNDGLPRVNENFFRRAMSMWSSRYLVSWRH